MTRRAVMVLAAALLVLLVLLPVTGDAEHDAPAAAPIVPCHWQAEYDDTLDELGADPARWSIRTGGAPWWGRMYADPPLVLVSRDDVPCDAVADVVRHEWTHLLQLDRHGTWAAVQAAYGGQRGAERVADCASLLLGSTLAPYVDRVACRPAELDAARELTRHADARRTSP